MDIKSNQIKSKCKYLTCDQKLGGSQFSLLHARIEINGYKLKEQELSYRKQIARQLHKH